MRIVTPHIPDKKTAFMLTQSYYEQLMGGGVKIYEFTPGFIHAKCFVCDDRVATVGTVNLDYRSLWNPSTSLSGEIAWITFSSLIWAGSGNWTKIPSTSILPFICSGKTGR